MYTLDLRFLDTEATIAAFLVPTGEGPVLIETGPHSTLPHLETAVQNLGFSLQDIRHVLITHIHLDHAGASWALAQQGATIYLHPAGVRHLAAPERLWQSASQIYGDKMEYLWGQMQPTPLEQLRPMEHGEQLSIGGQTFTAWHTPGHAVHHLAWQWQLELFCGDVAGVRIGSGPVVPPCPPPDIDVEAWQASIQLIRDLKPAALHLTHFGKVEKTDIPFHLNELSRRLNEYAAWMQPHFEAGHSSQEITPAFMAFAQADLQNHGVDAAGLDQYEKANPAWMSVAGLLRYWKKKQ